MNNQRPNDFVWAHDTNANLNEPFDDLKKQGWNYGDIPTASHFNWLFNQISKWQTYLEEQSKLTANGMVELAKKLESTRSDLRMTQMYLKSVLDVLMAVRARVMEHHPHPPLPIFTIYAFEGFSSHDHLPLSHGPTLPTTDAGNLEPIPDASAEEEHRWEGAKLTRSTPLNPSGV